MFFLFRGTEVSFNILAFIAKERAGKYRSLTYAEACGLSTFVKHVLFNAVSISLNQEF